MDARVRSVNVGHGREGIGSRGRTTGIDKRAVASIEVRDPGPKKGGLGSGVVGDDVLNHKHHGGTRQAVYAVAREELDHWAAEIGRPLSDGTFGENLTTEGLDPDGALVGERWQVGETVLEVCGPRVPCANFAAWMGEKGWVRRFVEHGRPGAYLAVVTPGTIRPGDTVTVLERPAHGITVSMVLAAWFGDDTTARIVLDAGVLGEDDHAELAKATSPERV
ncbi:MOSC domain-containing protein [Phycicoccus duodecadis]|uniref:MOSC domain-containing protein YiiM n=1 Tax=Phycicoccus duodecadis TaxID=173053 RepID=A0A2N3YK71_9MICO|nr:MOSC domain-containing protein [Phycicoccus duodecadis]PKW27250.1 MOSC domain-containing protein YiiM [Phycicoccus duodecadis]